jgi:plastocyanin
MRCNHPAERLVWTAVFLGALLSLARPVQAADAVVAAMSADGIQRATIVVDSYAYRPDRLIVRPGVPVALTLTSVTWLVPHNFVLDDPAAGFALNEEIPAGKTITLRFTPQREGTFAFFCDKRLLFFHSHREKGMEGTLLVEPEAAGHD